MGALHEGHLSLVRLARRESDFVVVSIFVNPLQFAPGEDFARYPRAEEKDLALLAAEDVHAVYLPAAADLYPADFSTAVEVSGVSEGGEGEARPGHFRGVATVVLALFNLVQPDVAVFGEKDAQQVAVLRQMVRDLHLPVVIVPGPTIREADGLAMSSRNAYLAPEERKAAAVLFRALSATRALIACGERRADALRTALRKELATEPRAQVEYAEVVDAETFQPVEQVAGRLVLPLAVRLGATRLIDNIQLTVGA
jgi:pantoate--beta-alanine ligase